MSELARKFWQPYLREREKNPAADSKTTILGSRIPVGDGLFFMIGTISYRPAKTASAERAGNLAGRLENEKPR